MFANEIWIHIYINGPQAEIDRFKKLCSVLEFEGYTDEDVVDFQALMPHSSLGQPYSTWNGVDTACQKPGEFHFGFDTSGSCPEAIFECLADEFPTLVFCVSCVASMDEFRAEGNYNDPPSSRSFVYSEVAEDYWI